MPYYFHPRANLSKKFSIEQNEDVFLIKLKDGSIGAFYYYPDKEPPYNLELMLFSKKAIDQKLIDKVLEFARKNIFKK